MRTIQVRPSRNPRWQKRRGWEVFETKGASPVYCGVTGTRIRPELCTSTRGLSAYRDTRTWCGVEPRRSILPSL